MVAKTALRRARVTLCAVLLAGCAPAADKNPDEDKSGSDGLLPDSDSVRRVSNEDPLKQSHERLMQGAQLLSPAGTNGIRVLVLKGTPYQMGYQHGVLLAEAIEGFWYDLQSNFIWLTAIRFAETKGPHDDGEEGETYVEGALRNSYDFIKEECAGLSDGAGQVVSVDRCVALASVTWILEDLVPRHVPNAPDALACSQFVARGLATADGKLIHGRNMDWLAIDAILENPLIIVRHPEGGLTNVSIAWPGMIGTLTGMNEAGLSIAIDENNCHEGHRDLDGAPPLQQIARILQQATDLREARAMLEEADQAVCEIIVMSHGPSRTATQFEITASGVGAWEIDAEDVLYAANHFAFTEMTDHQSDPDIEDLTRGSVTRFTRLRERLTGASLPPHRGLSPDAPDYAFGRIDVAMAIDILRDPLDLRVESNRYSFPCTEFEDGVSAVGNNHNMHSVVMVPEDLRVWIATGWDEQCVNPIYNPYIGFDLEELFDSRVTPGRVPTFDPPYNGSYGNGVHED